MGVKEAMKRALPFPAVSPPRPLGTFATYFLTPCLDTAMKPETLSSDISPSQYLLGPPNLPSAVSNHPQPLIMLPRVTFSGPWTRGIFLI